MARRASRTASRPHAPYRKRAVAVERTREHLEPGPIVLVSSAYRGERNVMTLGWHMMLDYSVVGTYIWDANHSFELIRRSKQCVINVPTRELLDTAVRIGNCSGREGDKLDRFGLTAVAATHVEAPLISECYASFECRLADGRQIAKHRLFIWDVVAAHVAPVTAPQTFHYRGRGTFMLAGRAVSRRRLFKPEMLES